MVKKRKVKKPKVLTLKKILKKINSFDKSAIYYFISRNNRSNEFLVFIHGLGCNNSIFRYEETFFIYNKLNVINVDLRGHGLSENLKGKISLEDFARDLYLILKKEKVKKIYLIGYSMGGFISLKFYSLSQNIVKKIVLIDTSYALNIQTIRPFMLFLALLFFGLIILPARIFNVTIKRELDFSKYKWKNTFIIIYLIGLSNSLKNLSYSINAMLKENLSDILDKIKVPTLIIEDRHDLIFSKMSYKFEHRKISKSKLKIEEGDHFSILEKSDVIEQDIFKFIRK